MMAGYSCKDCETAAAAILPFWFREATRAYGERSTMPGARSLLLISLASVAIPADRGIAQALFQFRFRFAAARKLKPICRLTPIRIIQLREASTKTSTCSSRHARRSAIRPASRRARSPSTPMSASSISRLGAGRALQYGIGVGRQGFSWKGTAEIGRKAFWPGWTPPPEMIDRSAVPAAAYGRRHGEPTRRASPLSV